MPPKAGTVERRVIARVEAGPQGADSRFIITNLPGLPKTLYEKVYCASGQAENLIKAHKLHLASDRTSCTKATANQFRLLIHTAAYWLMLTLRGLAPKTSFWRDAQFDTIRLCLIKVAGRVTEMVTRIKIALPTAYPLSGRLRRSRRPHRQAAAVSDGARRPQNKPLGATANPNHPRQSRHRKLIRANSHTNGRRQKPRQGPWNAYGPPPFPHTSTAERGHQTPRTGRDVAGIGRQLRPQHNDHAPRDASSLDFAAFNPC